VELVMDFEIGEGGERMRRKFIISVSINCNFSSWNVLSVTTEFPRSADHIPRASETRLILCFWTLMPYAVYDAGKVEVKLSLCTRYEDMWAKLGFSTYAL
jgi:hypothetical protein